MLIVKQLHGTSFLSGVREATANDRRSKSCLRGVVAWISNSKNKHGKESERCPRGFFKIKNRQEIGKRQPNVALSFGNFGHFP